MYLNQILIVLLGLDGSLRLLHSQHSRIIGAMDLPVGLILVTLPSFQLFGVFLAPEGFNFLTATVVDIGSGCDIVELNDGGLLGLQLSDSFVDLFSLFRLLLTLGGGLRLLEDLLGRGELVDRLRRRRARQILVRVEATDRCDVGNIGQLEEIVRLRRGAEPILTVVLDEVAGLVSIPVLAIFLSGVIPLAVVVSTVVVAATVLQPELFGHRREGDAFWQVRQRIDELTLLFFVVVEAAAVAKLAGSVGGPVLTRDGLVVGVDGAEGSLAEVLGQGIIRLSELVRAMRELAILVEWAIAGLQEVPAELSLILLFERVELALVSVEIVVVRLLGQMSEHLLRRVVEIALLLGLVLVVLGLAGAAVRGIGCLGGRVLTIAAFLVTGVLPLRLGSLQVIAALTVFRLLRRGRLLLRGRRLRRVGGRLGRRRLFGRGRDGFFGSLLGGHGFK
jgi:hypothetical protein